MTKLYRTLHGLVLEILLLIDFTLPVTWIIVCALPWINQYNPIISFVFDVVFIIFLASFVSWLDHTTSHMIEVEKEWETATDKK